MALPSSSSECLLEIFAFSLTKPTAHFSAHEMDRLCNRHDDDASQINISNRLIPKIKITLPNQLAFSLRVRTSRFFHNNNPKSSFPPPLVWPVADRLYRGTRGKQTAMVMAISTVLICWIGVGLARWVNARELGSMELGQLVLFSFFFGGGKPLT